MENQDPSWGIQIFNDKYDTVIPLLLIKAVTVMNYKDAYLAFHYYNWLDFVICLDERFNKYGISHNLEEVNEFYLYNEYLEYFRKKFYHYPDDTIHNIKVIDDLIGIRNEYLGLSPDSLLIEEIRKEQLELLKIVTFEEYKKQFYDNK